MSFHSDKGITWLLVAGLAAGFWKGSGADGFCQAEQPQQTTMKHIVSKWPNGRPMQEHSFVTNSSGKRILQGPETYYFDNGKKRLELQYAHDKRNGPLTEWDSEGRVMRQGFWKDDRETGKWTWFQPAGDKMAECTYENGKIIGKKAYWRNEKVVAEESHDSNGFVSQYSSWYDSGQLRQQGTFKAGNKHGTWTYWGQKGKVVAKGEWKNGKPWEDICGVPLAGDAGSVGGLESFGRYHKGELIEKVNVSVH